MTDSKTHFSKSCAIEDVDKTNSYINHLRQVIRENWNLKYSACFVICPLPKESPTSDKVPETVSVVARLKAAPTNRILVQNRPENRSKDKELLAVCVKPLHYDYNRVR